MLLVVPALGYSKQPPFLGLTFVIAHQCGHHTNYIRRALIWTDHRLSRALKLRTNQFAVCSSLTHPSEAWTLTEPVMRRVNSFNSRCLHIITGQDYRVTATAPEYDLLLAIRQRRLRYLCHILRMPESRVVRRALVALAKGGTVYPKGSLFMDCQAMEMHQLVALAQRRCAWNPLVKQLR